MSPDACPACSGSWPATDHRIADCGVVVAYLFEDQFFPGWTVLVLKEHAVELFELSPEERSELIEVVSGVARALTRVFRSIKVNYALLGNQVPHIHWHIIPRTTDDPAPRDPVWMVHHDVRRLTSEAREARIRSIRRELVALGVGVE